MRLFDNYLTGLDEVLSKKVKITPELINEQRRFSATLNKAVEIERLSGDKELAVPEKIGGPKVLFNYDKTYLTRYFGINSDAFSEITIGPHPDFAAIDFHEQVYHHCVSVFVDIKGSTRLIEKYSLAEVRLIKDSLLTLAIQVANQFGGHVHRLQGDAIFMQFVRRDGTPNDAIINALNASAILTQFVSTDLANIMAQNQIKPLKIRVGIDFGDNDNVLWSHYGVPGCKELTTTSLHTDMAAKLQAKAADNSILIGGNVKEELDLKKDFWNYFQVEESMEMVYYISSRFTYSFYLFDWKNYLLSLPFMVKSSNGRDLEMRNNNVTIACYISNEDGSAEEKYYPNSKSIPKGKNITYKLMRGNSPYFKQSYEKIEWFANNSGNQAAEKKAEKHDFNKKYHDLNYCETTAAFLGHHYVECRIIKQHSGVEKVSFPIFVQ